MAVADLGSNSFRLVVYAYEPGRWWQHADEIREAVRISEGVGDDARLRDEPMRRAVRAAEVFDAFSRASHVEQVEAVATSAIRDAGNRDELLSQLAERTSLPVRVVSTHEEARYGYLAIANSTTIADGFGVDVGGGSVQVMHMRDRRLAADDSWPLGAVRMSERFLPGDEEADSKAIKALRKHVAREAGGFGEIEVPEAGLREGVFFERFLADLDPPLFPDVRRAAVENLASRYQADLTHPRHVAELSLQLFDELADADAHDLGPAERELLWSACMLHDIGTIVDYDDHHKHSRYLIENAGLPGFTPREVVLVALIARYHRKGTPDASELGKLAKKSDESRLAILSGMVRLAEQLERSRDGAVRAVRVESENGRIRLQPE